MVAREYDVCVWCEIHDRITGSVNPAPYVAMLSLKVTLPPKDILVLLTYRALSTVLSKNLQLMKVAFGTKISITAGCGEYNVVGLHIYCINVSSKDQSEE